MLGWGGGEGGREGLSVIICYFHEWTQKVKAFIGVLKSETC